MEKTLSKKQKTVYSAAAILVFLVLVYLGDTLIPMTSQWNMLMTVIKKGAIFALVAVSMNLLNGFTGLFSLGQAGFMLIGAYAYAISRFLRLSMMRFINISTADFLNSRFRRF